MAKILYNIRRVLNGTATIDNRRKYFIICLGIALIHFAFTIAFGLSQIMPLFYYNVAVTLFYSYHSFVTIRKQRYVFVEISAVVEILFHASFATYMLGWDWGFNLYTMSMVPFSFYFTYTLPQIRGKIAFPAIESTIVSVCFFVNRVICEHIEPLYKGDYPEGMQTVFYYFNSIIAFGLLVIFSVLFALELHYMQKKLEQENRELEEVASYDPLTNLLNRRSMNVKLSASLKEAQELGQSFCIMLADIDDFKVTNDTYGHECGDKVLIAVADLISRNVREKDAVCRWGGEEILVLLKGDLKIAQRVANRICEEVEQMVVKYKGQEVRVTLTIGLSEYKSEQTIRTMIEDADHNLYYGKQHGKNQCVSNK